MPRKANKPIDKTETQVNKKENKSDPQKERDAFIASLRKQGMIGDIHKKIDFISTGSYVINRLIGDGSLKSLPGGIPRGYLTEIYGDESTGKTTLALHIAKQVLAAGEIVLYADFEQSLRAQLNYVKNIGIDTTSPNFVHLTPPSLQEGAKIIGNSLIKLRPTVVIIDSVAAMMPKETVEKDADEPSAIGQHARLVGSFINWISKKLQKYNCALILINQFRANIKSSQYDPGPKQITTGGNALKYFVALRIRLKHTSNKEKVKVTSEITGMPEDKLVSQEVKVVIEKNKIDMPWKSGPIYVVFGYGIDNIMSLITLGINKRIIKKTAGYLTWKDPSNDENSFSVNGKQALKKHLVENPKILEALQPYLMPARDDQEMDSTQEALEALGVENLSDEEKEQLKEIRKIKGLTTEDLDLSEDELNDLGSLEEITKAMGEPSQEDK